MECAEAVADGRPIDWALAEASATDDESRAIIAKLRAVASINGLFGTVDAPARTGRIDRRILPTGTSWGPLRILAHIGRGSFGDVYRAADPTLDRDVALKLSPEGDESVATQVVEEGRLMARYPIRTSSQSTAHSASRA